MDIDAQAAAALAARERRVVARLMLAAGHVMARCTGVKHEKVPFSDRCGKRRERQ
jgi:hypothetical protein